MVSTVDYIALKNSHSIFYLFIRYTSAQFMTNKQIICWKYFREYFDDDVSYTL